MFQSDEQFWCIAEALLADRLDPRNGIHPAFELTAILTPLLVLPLLGVPTPRHKTKDNRYLACLQPFYGVLFVTS